MNARLAFRIAGSLLFAVALCATSGCAHYQLGTGSRVSFRTLYVEPVANKTLLPQAQALLATRLREAFARDGRVTLADSPDAADAMLTVAITDYHRDVAAVREDDTGLARKYNLTLGVTCTLRERQVPAPRFSNRVITAEREAFTDSGQLQSEYQTLPLLADSIAAKVVHASLDVW